MKHCAPLIALALLAGCSMAPKYVQPDLPVPASWPIGDAYLARDVELADVAAFLDEQLQAH